MSIHMVKDDIVSATEVSKNFGRIRDLVKEKSQLVVFKNNKPDLVLVDFEYFENIISTLNNLEDRDIYKMIEEREPYFDPNKGCSLDDLIKIDSDLRAQGK